MSTKGSTLRRLIHGVIGGVLGSIIYSLLFAQFEGGLELVDLALGSLPLQIATFLSIDVEIVTGVIIWIGIGLTFAITAILLVKFVNWNMLDWTKNIILGLVYGVVLWSAVQAVPTLISALGKQTTAIDYLALFATLLGHLLLGFVASVVFVFLERRGRVTKRGEECESKI